MDKADAIVAACKLQFETMVGQLIADSHGLTNEDEQQLRESFSQIQRGTAGAEIGRVRLERLGKPVPNP